MVPPNRLFISVNIDESYSPSNKQGGACGVFRDHNGNWLAGFTANFYYLSSNQAEI